MNSEMLSSPSRTAFEHIAALHPDDAATEATDRFGRPRLSVISFFIARSRAARHPASLRDVRGLGRCPDRNRYEVVHMSNDGVPHLGGRSSQLVPHNVDVADEQPQRGSVGLYPPQERILRTDDERRQRRPGHAHCENAAWRVDA